MQCHGCGMSLRDGEYECWSCATVSRTANEINRFVVPEGWGIFWAEDRLMIQRDDETQDLADDHEAVAHVKRLAKEGSAIHQLALQVVEGGQ